MPSPYRGGHRDPRAEGFPGAVRYDCHSLLHRLSRAMVFKSRPVQQPRRLKRRSRGTPKPSQTPGNAQPISEIPISTRLLTAGSFFGDFRTPAPSETLHERRRFAFGGRHARADIRDAHTIQECSIGRLELPLRRLSRAARALGACDCMTVATAALTARMPEIVDPTGSTTARRPHAASARALGNVSANVARSASVPAETRMQRFSGATPGMRTKTPCAMRPSSTRLA